MEKKVRGAGRSKRIRLFSLDTKDKVSVHRFLHTALLRYFCLVIRSIIFLWCLPATIFAKLITRLVNRNTVVRIGCKMAALLRTV